MNEPPRFRRSSRRRSPPWEIRPETHPRWTAPPARFVRGPLSATLVWGGLLAAWGIACAGGGGAVGGRQQRMLMLWGGVDARGVPRLDPSFVLDGSPHIPVSGGPHLIAGRDARGSDLFSLRFEMPEVADGDGSSSFVFFLPAREEWADLLASITLAGPGGSFTLDRNTDLPMAILRSPETGQIRRFVRNLPPGPEARAVAARLAAEKGFELSFSRGIPDPADWRR
ncbi:MAG: hypothetical protein OXU64_08285 [Gemmatimonadota bacterium]|nr:hypothetical protein [Gemmatimonadota bacterium]